MKKDNLTHREREVCDLVTRGLTGKEIAFRLQISPRTVEVHRQNVFNKYGVINSAALTRIVVTEELAKKDSP